MPGVAFRRRLGAVLDVAQARRQVLVDPAPRVGAERFQIIDFDGVCYRGLPVPPRFGVSIY